MATKLALCTKRRLWLLVEIATMLWVGSNAVYGRELLEGCAHIGNLLARIPTWLRLLTMHHLRVGRLERHLLHLMHEAATVAAIEAVL